MVVVAVVGAAAMYVLLGRQLRNELDTKLIQQLNHYQQVVGSTPDPQALAEATERFLSGSQSSGLRQEAVVFSMQTMDGTVVSNSQEVRLEDLPATQTVLESGTPVLLDTTLNAQQYRVVGTPIVLGGEQIGAVEMAASLSSINDTLGRLLVLLIVGGALGCVLVGAGTWILLGRALDPVRRITRTAAAITREDLSRRIGYEGPQDEIGELAVTMDAMLDRLQAAFAAQERFISDASHELRTPLTIIKGHLQVLDRQESPDPVFVRQEHALVLDELDRMNRLVSDLLTLARATRVDFLRKESIDLDGFLTSLVQQGPHLGSRAWVLDSLPGGTLRADQDRLTQVFLNLMQNAVQHSAEGAVIALGGTRVPDRVMLWVRDEGDGMSEETASHIFDRFYRGADQKDFGVGLGLAIVKAIVEAHAGSIHVESQAGAGTRFVISLPL
jgi:signal transduction histidine kinase